MSALSALAPLAVASYKAHIQAPFTLAETLGNITKQHKAQRIKELGQKFIEQGDFSPEGIKVFAEEHGLGPAEMFNLVKTVKAFNDWKEQRNPLVRVSRTLPDGSTVIEFKRQNDLVQQGSVQTKPPDMVRMINRETKEVKQFPANNLPASVDWMKEEDYRRLKPEKPVHVIDKTTGHEYYVTRKELAQNPNLQSFELYKLQKGAKGKRGSGNNNSNASLIKSMVSLYNSVLGKWKPVGAQLFNEDGSLNKDVQVSAWENLVKHMESGDNYAKQDFNFLQRVKNRIEKIGGIESVGASQNKTINQQETAQHTATAVLGMIANYMMEKGGQFPEKGTQEYQAIEKFKKYYPDLWQNEVAPKIEKMMDVLSGGSRQNQPTEQSESFTQSPQQGQSGYDLSSLYTSPWYTNPQGLLMKQIMDVPPALGSLLQKIARSNGVNNARNYVNSLSKKYGRGPRVDLSGLRRIVGYPGEAMAGTTRWFK